MPTAQSQQQAQEQKQYFVAECKSLIELKKKPERSCYTLSLIQMLERDVCLFLLVFIIVGRIALVDPAKARNIEDRILILAQQGSITSVYAMSLFLNQ